jgi:hypothetical protein
VIQDLVFFGGVDSYAHHFNQCFPTSQDSNGVMVHEVPVAMIVLVGTAVSLPQLRLNAY